MPALARVAPFSGFWRLWCTCLLHEAHYASAKANYCPNDCDQYHYDVPPANINTTAHIVGMIVGFLIGLSYFHPKRIVSWRRQSNAELRDQFLSS